MSRFLTTARFLRARLDGRVVWNVNSTAAGGGVAELLRSVVAYTRGVGVDVRWLLVEGPPEFFALTKRIHHALHGESGDGSDLDGERRGLFEAVSRENARQLLALVRPGDVVILHDPQPAGLVPYLTDAGIPVIWRCHIGADEPNAESGAGWGFLSPYVQTADAYVFTREAFVPQFCTRERAVIIPPTIDPFSPKNHELTPESTRAILAYTGIIAGPPGSGAREFIREDGSTGRIDRTALVLRSGEAPSWETPLVVQVSRWDPLKDPVGVLEGFARLVNRSAHHEAHLVLAGPEAHSVPDDPEGPLVYERVVAAWRHLPEPVQGRIHLVSLPMSDVEENGAIVNAIQRHAAIVVQKSIHEGFGLTVAEAMWKSRPVLCSATGGIQDQVEDGVTGMLLADPRDIEMFSDTLEALLADPTRAAELGRAARERVRRDFLVLTALERWGTIVDRIARGPNRAASTPLAGG